MCVCVRPSQERRHRSKLPRALRGLMGEANIRYARGEKEDAILMCMEIIRQGGLITNPPSLTISPSPSGH